MMRKILADENYVLFSESSYNPITKRTICRYKVVPQKNDLHMFIEVTEGRFFARFPEGLSFTGRDGNLWVQAIRNAEAFIARATPFVKQPEGEEES